MRRKMTVLLLAGMLLCGVAANSQQVGTTQAPPQATAQPGAVFDAALEALAKQVNDNPAFIKSAEFKNLPLDLRTAVIRRAADDTIKQQNDEEQKAQAAAKAAQEQAQKKQQSAAQPCVAPKKPGLGDMLKQRAQQMAQREEDKLGGKISRATGGGSLPSVTDVTGLDPRPAKPCSATATARQ